MDNQLFVFDTSSDPRLAIPSTSGEAPCHTLPLRPAPPSKLTLQPGLPDSLPPKPIANDQPQHPPDPESNDAGPPARRYWKEPTGVTCTICHEPDHSAKNCDHQLCLTCGAIDEHATRLCPVSLVCFACGSRGHLSRHCPTSASSRILGKDCVRCGSSNHISLNCPMIWRCYEELKVIRRKPKPLKLACYNCGDSGDHFGDECPFARAGRSNFRPDPSAFSISLYSHEHFHDSSRARSSHQHSGARDSDRYARSRDSDRYARDSDRHARDSDYPTRQSDHRARDSDHRPRDSNNRAREKTRSRASPPLPSRTLPRRPPPQAYEEADEPEDWFSRRHRANKQNGSRQSPRPPPTNSGNDHRASNGGQRKNEKESDGQKKNPRDEREPQRSNGKGSGHGGGGGGGNSNQNKKVRIGGSYQGGYVKK